MNQKERMLAGLPYKPWLDGLEEERTRCKEKIYELNCLHPRDRERIPELLGKVEKLSFNIKLTTFVYHYQRSGVAEKDARSLLQETEELLNVMEEVLLR